MIPQKLKRRASLISLPKVEMPDNFADTPLWKLDPDYKAPTEQTTQPDAPTTEQPFETADKSKARTTKSTPEPSRSHNTAEEPTFVVVRRPRASNSVPNSYTADQRPQSSPTEQTGSPSKKPARSESAASDPIAGNKTLPASSSSQNPDSKRTPSNRLRKGLSVILGGPKADSPPLSPEQLLDESKNRDPMPDSWELLEARLNYHLSELDRIKDYIKLQNQVIEEHKQRLHDVMNWASGKAFYHLLGTTPHRCCAVSNGLLPYIFSLASAVVLLRSLTRTYHRHSTIPQQASNDDRRCPQSP